MSAAAAQDEHKALVRRFVDKVSNGGRRERSDTLIADDDIEQASGSEGAGREGIHHMVLLLPTAFPDFNVTIEDRRGVR